MMKNKKRIISFMLLLSIVFTNVTIVNAIEVVSGNDSNQVQSEGENASDVKETRALIYEKESNDTISTANAISVNSGNQYKGYLSSGSDVDYFKFTINSTSKVTVDFADSTDRADWYVTVVDSKGKKVIKDDRTDRSDKRIVCLAKGTYYIKLRASVDSNDNTYCIKVNSQSGDYEQEYNDSIESATPISTNKFYKGTYTTDRDSDYYKINLNKNGILSLQMSMVTGDYEPEVSLLDKNGEVYDLWDHDINKGIGLKAGVYYLHLKKNSYFQNIGEEYQFKVNFKEDNYFETETNDTKETATPMILNKTYNAFLKRDDVDYYKFTLNSNKNIKLKMTYIANNNYWGNSIAFKIVDEKGNLYLDSKTDNETGAFLSSKYINFKSGTYYLQVKRFTNADGKYNISIDEQPDWENHWAKNEIRYAMNKGWIENTNKFRPEDSITRAEFIKIVNKAFGYTSKTSVPFTDVKSSEWYYNEVAIALKNGVISNKNKTFRPNDPISREEVAVILTNIKKNKDSKIDKLNKYSDKGQVSEWALTSVEGAIEAGYMGQNTTKFRPKSHITRGESVATLYRVAK